MIQNYFKSALQIIKKYKLFTFINVTGLSIALSVSFIILLYVINELSFNSSHEKRNDVFRVVTYNSDYNNSMAGTPYILAETLKKEFPQVERATQYRYINNIKLKVKDDFIDIDNTIATGADIFDIFTIPLVYQMDKNHLLDQKNSILLSETLANKIFLNTNIVGQEIDGIINNVNQTFVITGVYKDLPENSIFRPDCLVNSKWTISELNNIWNIKNSDESWDVEAWYTWILLNDNKQASQIEDLLPEFVKRHKSENPKIQYKLQCLNDYYLNSENILNTKNTGNIKNIKLFSLIASIIILLAGLNYILLSTTISYSRSKEIAIRKTNGASTSKIKLQIYFESIIITLLALPIALLLLSLFYKYAASLFNTRLLFISNNIWLYILFFLGITLIIGITSGVYLAEFLSKQNVIQILKKQSISLKSKIGLKDALIVCELIIFCAFISCSYIIYDQYKFFLTKDPGYNTQNILLVNVDINNQNYNPIISELKSAPFVIDASFTMHSLPMRHIMSMMVPQYKNKDKKVEIEGMAIGYNFIETMGLKILDGRSFSENFGSDSINAVVLNENAVKKLGIEDPVGKEFSGFKIIGVIKDFNLHALYTDIPPLYFCMAPSKYISQIIIQYTPNNQNQVIGLINEVWTKNNIDSPVDYQTIEEVTNELYQSEKNLTEIILWATLFTLLISMMGLFGLTIFVADSKQKEIGIKKVMGCTEYSIIKIFVQRNIILVIISGAIASPISYYIMNDWLGNFAYKINLNAWYFISTIILASVIVSFTVFVHSYNAATSNPVEALKYE